jgi:archaemetzincin
MQIVPLPPIRSGFLFVFAIAMLLTGAGCQPNLPPANRVFVVQPFKGISTEDIKAVYEKLLKVNPKGVLKPPTALPLNAYYRSGNRYRADSIISYLAKFGNADTVIIGLTNHDISTRNVKATDWGVMGLGFQPGNACVISTYRLNKTKIADQFYKLALHELAHTQGLPHCPNKTCFMRDAEGGNYLDEETGFCKSCTAFLKSKGWQLPN